jgi:type IV fimbrial biogenesis protein FimT
MKSYPPIKLSYLTLPSARLELGFTALELLITMAILAILLGVGVPSLGRTIASAKVKSASSSIYLAMMKARSEAAKRNITVSITPLAGSWSSGWTMSDANGTTLENQDGLKGVTVANGPDSVIYLSSGRIKSGTSIAFLVQSAGSYTFQNCISADLSGHPYTKDSAC